LYDYYVRCKIDRHGFMNRLSVYAVGGLTVSALMSYLMPNYAQAQQVKPDDSRIKTEYLEYAFGLSPVIMVSRIVFPEPFGPVNCQKSPLFSSSLFHSKFWNHHIERKHF
jgi:hypothetical protein